MTEGMRTCRYCGRETGIESNFCWYCARELEPRPERPDVTSPESKVPGWVWAGLGLLVLALMIGFLLK